MSLITTLGGKTSNSFNTVATADSYLASSPYNLTAWTALSSAQKEILLIDSCRWFKRKLWAGYTVYVNQALPFPRWFLDTDTIEIPDDIKRAHAYVAYAVYYRGSRDLTNPADGRSVESEIKSEQLYQDISVVYADVPIVKSNASEYDFIASDFFHIDDLIAPYETSIGISPALTGPVKLDEVA